MVGKEIKLSKKNRQYQLWIGLVLLIVAIALVLVAVMNAMKGKETGDLKIGGEARVTGLVCGDKELVHPAFADVSMVSHSGTITANFRDDKLSSISLVFEADYDTEQRAKEGEAFARANYNLILTNKYGEKDDIFSDGFSLDGTKMQMVQTARDISKINPNTVTYFLLDQGTSIAKTLDELKEQYEAKGFACEISE